MGLFGKILGEVAKSIIDNVTTEVDCDVCGVPMKHRGDNCYQCTNCERMAVIRDGETFYCDLDDEDDYYEEDEDGYAYEDVYDEVPPGCRACGGDYPNCTDSCPMFDD